MPTVQQLAAKLANAFETRNRDNGEQFATLRDGAPEWMTEVVHAAHGDMLPDDWRYNAVRLLAFRMADAGERDLDDVRCEACDSEVEIYNSKLIDWLGSHGSRASYCDDAAEEFGFDPKGGIIKLIQLGQYAELDEVWGLLVGALEEAAEGMPKEWAAGWNMPGYMPDAEPAEFDSWEEARDYLKGEIEEAAEREDDETPANIALATLGEITEGTPVTVTVGNYAYWIAFQSE